MSPGPAEIGLIVLAVTLLFGYERLPDASCSFGRSLRIVKGEVDGLRQGGSPADEDGPECGRAVLADRGALTGRLGVTEVGEPAAQHAVQVLGADDLAGRRPGPGMGEHSVLLRATQASVGADVRLER
jgi:sec-independent protein translocase protein TatA